MASWSEQVEALVMGALVLARSRAGRIAAVNVEVPPTLPLEQVRALLLTRLSACGYPGLEIVAHPGVGALRITSAEFER
jgi:hypothetical protein